MLPDVNLHALYRFRYTYVAEDRDADLYVLNSLPKNVDEAVYRM